MEMTLRWYGSKFDTVKLWQIRQIPGVTGVITTLYGTQPGELWSQERIHALKTEVESAGLNLSGIESVNVSDAIKTGSKDRDKDIDTYIKTLENLGKEDIHMVCYNFMPVFDWTRTELARVKKDGSTCLAYTQHAAHPSACGTFDMYEIMKALYDIHFDGPIRPDHGRAIWGEVAMPGYGLYDRALGAVYIYGLWEAIEKSESRR